MELLRRQIVHTITLDDEDIALLGALDDGLDRVRLAQPELWERLLKPGAERFTRLVRLVE